MWSVGVRESSVKQELDPLSVAQWTDWWLLVERAKRPKLVKTSADSEFAQLRLAWQVTYLTAVGDVYKTLTYFKVSTENVG